MYPVSLYLFLGLLLASIRVLLEYNKWNKETPSSMKGFGLAVLISMSGFLFHISDHSFGMVTVFVFTFWNFFEFFSNYFHNQHIFYVGTVNYFDRLIRYLFTYESRAKFAIHIITIIIIVIISCLKEKI